MTFMRSKTLEVGCQGANPSVVRSKTVHFGVTDTNGDTHGPQFGNYLKPCPDLVETHSLVLSQREAKTRAQTEQKRGSTRIVGLKRAMTISLPFPCIDNDFEELVVRACNTKTGIDDSDEYMRDNCPGSRLSSRGSPTQEISKELETFDAAADLQESPVGMVHAKDDDFVLISPSPEVTELFARNHDSVSPVPSSTEILNSLESNSNSPNLRWAETKDHAAVQGHEQLLSDENERDMNYQISLSPANKPSVLKLDIDPSYERPDITPTLASHPPACGNTRSIHKPLKDLINKTNQNCYNADPDRVHYKAGLSKKRTMPHLHSRFNSKE